MSSLATTIATREVPEGSIALYWLCQAGFAFKTNAGQIVYIDPYLSDVVERVVGFKRMMTSPLQAEEVAADLIICTHEHLDHMDVDALPALAANPRAHFAGPIECMKEFAKQKIPADRCHLLEEGKSVTVGGIKVHAVYADHGELAPDALGVVLDLDGVRVYHTGDTAYRPEQFQPAIQMRPDILLPCINGAYRQHGLAGGRPADATGCTARGDADALLDVCGAKRRSSKISSTLRGTRARRANDIDEAG